MYFSDVQNAISRGIVNDVRDTFRALAAREDVILTAEGAEIANGSKCRLLIATCEFLEADGAIMPSGACDELDLPPGSTYGDGAAEVIAQIARSSWRFRPAR